jgi:hypothetical protein
MNMLHTVPLNAREEANLIGYWSRHTVHDPNTGLLLHDDFRPSAEDTAKSAQNPRKPWMHGVHYNINADNAVKAYRPLRSRDCIPAESISILERQRINSDARAWQSMQVSFPPGPVWNQNTSVKWASRDPRFKKKINT